MLKSVAVLIFAFFLCGQSARAMTAMYSCTALFKDPTEADILFEQAALNVEAATEQVSAIFDAKLSSAKLGAFNDSKSDVSRLNVYVLSFPNGIYLKLLSSLTADLKIYYKINVGINPKIAKDPHGKILQEARRVLYRNQDGSFPVLVQVAELEKVTVVIDWTETDARRLTRYLRRLSRELNQVDPTARYFLRP